MGGGVERVSVLWSGRLCQFGIWGVGSWSTYRRRSPGLDRQPSDGSEWACSCSRIQVSTSPRVKTGLNRIRAWLHLSVPEDGCVVGLHRVALLAGGPCLFRRLFMGSAAVQGDLWGRAPGDWVGMQEVQHAPLWEATLDATRVGTGTRLLDAGCGGGGAQCACRRSRGVGERIGCL
jgi:hypothetical protein